MAANTFIQDISYNGNGGIDKPEAPQGSFPNILTMLYIKAKTCYNYVNIFGRYIINVFPQCGGEDNQRKQ